MKLPLKLYYLSFITIVSCTSIVPENHPSQRDPGQNGKTERTNLNLPDTTTEPSIADDILTTEESKVVEDLPDFPHKVDDVLLPNGKTISEFSKSLRTQAESKPDGPQDAKNTLIKKMILSGEGYIDRGKHTYKGSDNVPDQFGLAYSFGAKDIKPNKPSTGYCRIPVRGLDCSGMLYRLAIDSGLPLPATSADELSKEETWNKAFASSSDYKKLKATRIGAISTKDMEAGDIIYWLKKDNNRANHIGVILTLKSGGLGVYQSNGSDGSGEKNACITCPDGKVNPDCLNEVCLKNEEEKNRGLKRGPRTITLNDPYWFGKDKPYSVLRLTTEIDGKWSVSARCIGQSKNIFDASINLKDTMTGDFKETGSGVDYTGISIRIALEGNYNKKENVLQGILKIYAEDDTESAREDSFSIRLNEDDTGYKRMSALVVTDACPLELKLMNLNN